MQPIYVPQLLKAPDQTLTLQVETYLSDLESLTPVQGTVTVTHRGNFLEASGQAVAIITLSCDRCLQQYNYRLAINTSEIIWLQAQAEIDALEQEVALEDLVETVEPTGHFDVAQWLYEQLCLEIPQRQICDRTCQGIQVSLNDQIKPAIDNRWSALEAFKDSLN
jgi:uncharacterized protein